MFTIIAELAILICKTHITFQTVFTISIYGAVRYSPFLLSTLDNSLWRKSGMAKAALAGMILLPMLVDIGIVELSEVV